MAKKAEFSDLVSLLSVSCGLDLANSEIELDSDVFELNCRECSNCAPNIVIIISACPPSMCNLHLQIKLR